MNVLTSKTAVGCRLANAYFKRSFYLYSPEPFHPLSDRVPEYKSAEEAVQVIQSGEPTILRNCGAFITNERTHFTDLVLLLYCTGARCLFLIKYFIPLETTCHCQISCILTRINCMPT